MKKATINKLHAIAEFQKRLAWHNFEAAKHSTMFKKELEDCARTAAQHCRETREEIKRLMDSENSQQLHLQWLDAGAPDNWWD